MATAHATQRRPAVLGDLLPGALARDAALVLGAAAFAGLAAQIAVPLPGTPVPVTGQTFAVLLAGRIIKVANAYDDLVGDSADRDRGAAVLERLRLDSAAEYDPTVVEALSRVVDRRPRQ